MSKRQKSPELLQPRPADQIAILESGIERLVNHFLDAMESAKREGRDIDQALKEADQQIKTGNVFRPS